MPSTREFRGALNTITNVVEESCSDDWTLFVELAFPAAGEALWLLLVPQPDEILEEYLQPTKKRSSRKGGRDGRGRRQATRYRALRWWQKITFPHLDGIIADRLPGVQAVRGRNAGAKQRWIFDAINRIDRVLWYWLLLDVSSTFVVEWASGIVESRFCASTFDGLFIGNAFTPSLSTNLWLWNLASQMHPVTNRGWTVVSFGRIRRINPSPLVRGTVSVTVDATAGFNNNPAPTKYRLQIIATDGGGNQTTEESGLTSPLGNDELFSLTVAHSFIENFELAFRLIHEEGAFRRPENVSTTVNAFATPET